MSTIQKESYLYVEGCPRDRWDEVSAIQHAPFVWIQYCGSHFAGDPQDSIDSLLTMLRTYRLRREEQRPIYRQTIPEEYDFYTVDPCRGIENPDFCRWVDDSSIKPQFIDGERLYQADGVVRFSGNFEHYSFAFGIDTNHDDTTHALIEAIRWNLSNWESLK